MFIIHTIPHNEYMKLHIYATPEDGIGQQTLYELEKQTHVKKRVTEISVVPNIC